MLRSLPNAAPLAYLRRRWWREQCNRGEEEAQARLVRAARYQREVIGDDDAKESVA